MDVMYEICERFYEELEDIERDIDKRDKISKDEVELIDKLTHTIKSIKTVKAMEDSGYSHGGYYNRGGNSYGYDDRGHDEYYRRRSRDGSNRMRTDLERIMSRAQDEETRQTVQRMLDELR